MIYVRALFSKNKFSILAECFDEIARKIRARVFVRNFSLFKDAIAEAVSPPVLEENLHTSFHRLRVFVGF
jgi:hypothetical protein